MKTFKSYGKGPITYLGEPLELRPDRERRYCLRKDEHTEIPLHLVGCADLTQEENDAWREKLVQDGILTIRSKGGWFLEGAGVILNPSLFGIFYFTSLDYARQYKDLNYKFVQYGPIRICQVEE